MDLTRVTILGRFVKVLCFGSQNRVVFLNFILVRFFSVLLVLLKTPALILLKCFPSFSFFGLLQPMLVLPLWLDLYDYAARAIDSKMGLSVDMQALEKVRAISDVFVLPELQRAWKCHQCQ